MKNAIKEVKDETQREYDFSGGVRGKYVKPYAQGTRFLIAEEPESFE